MINYSHLVLAIQVIPYIFLPKVWMCFVYFHGSLWSEGTSAVTYYISVTALRPAWWRVGFANLLGYRSSRKLGAAAIMAMQISCQQICSNGHFPFLVRCQPSFMSAEQRHSTRHYLQRLLGSHSSRLRSFYDTFGLHKLGPGIGDLPGSGLYIVNPASTWRLRPLGQVSLRTRWSFHTCRKSQLLAPLYPLEEVRIYRWSRDFWWYSSGYFAYSCVPAGMSYIGMHVFCTTGCWDPWGQNTLALASTAECHYSQCRQIISFTKVCCWVLLVEDNVPLSTLE